MEQQHRANLEKLGRYLAKLSARHNEDHFRMSNFLYHRPDGAQPDPADQARIVKYTKQCFCGTVACAIGHAPLAMPKEFKEATKESTFKINGLIHGLNWWNLSYPLFGFATGDGTRIWDWLFSGNWAEDYQEDYYKSSWAAADRIAWLIDGKFDEYNLFGYEMDEAIGHAAKLGWITQSLHEYHIKKSKEIYFV